MSKRASEQASAKGGRVIRESCLNGVAHRNLDWMDCRISVYEKNSLPVSAASSMIAGRMSCHQAKLPARQRRNSQSEQ